MTDCPTLTAFAVRLRQFMAAAMGSGDSTSGDATFNALALELFALQFESNLVFRKFCLARKVSPGTVTHWSEVPFVPAGAFKEFELTSLPASERTAVFHSSGTTGQQPSRHFHSAESLALYEASLLPWFQRHVFTDQTRLEALVLTPPSVQVPHSSLAHMFHSVRRVSAATTFCGTVDATGAWSLDLDAANAVLEAAAKAGRPLLVMGTAFNFVHLLDGLAERNRRCLLPAGSRVLETGGYKGRSRSLPKSELHALIAARLDVAPDHIICEYGMSELSSQAYDTAIDGPRTSRPAPRTFHFPPWACVRIVSPETGVEVAEGETGLVQILDLANVWSVLAIQTGDLAIRRGRGFELLGRAADAEPRGCSLMAV